MPCARVAYGICAGYGDLESMACRDRVTGAKLPDGSKAGLCLDASSSTGCAQGLVDCNGICVDLQKDDKNCGTCGNVCPAYKLCDKGVCKCPNGGTDCNGVCTGTQYDTNNCGECGCKCKQAVPLCYLGKCYGGCDPGKVYCHVAPSPPSQCYSDGSCVDTLTDDQNCGSCGTTCGSGQFCVKGKCI